MRLFSTAFRTPVQDNPPFLAGCSFLCRLLITGLPLLALVLLLIFFATGKSLEDIVSRAAARNAQLQVQAMSIALEQTLLEARNQLLILAAGSMEQSEMTRRLKFRAGAEGLRYREAAFMGVNPDNRYILVNYGGEIISVPPGFALDPQTSPFHSFSAEQRPGHVGIGKPLEVVYSMVPVNKSLQTLPLRVIRLSTPVFGADGRFQGILTVSLDLTTLRDALALFAPPDEHNGAGDADNRIRSFFFDDQGWMLFQSEPAGSEAPETGLSSDAVRAGFRGDFGRPGFSTAFRPGPEHLSYWTMVAEAQAGRNGHFSPSDAGSWGDGLSRVEGISYAPVRFSAGVDGPRSIIGGVAVLDSSFTATRSGFKIMSIYVLGFAGGMLLLGLSLWWIARSAGRQWQQLTTGLAESNRQRSTAPLDLPTMPVDAEHLKLEINTLLARLREARAERVLEESEMLAHRLREPVEDLPDPASLPGRGLIGTSPPMLALSSQICKAAQVEADVLIIGETGTGKELVSESIHRLSSRAAGPFITINCGALDEGLLMDTLFGHVRGAFTEARQTRKGAFVTAQGGTLMLDEVGNAAPKVQQALLRALSTRRIRPLGSDQDMPFDTRIIAATNAELLGDAAAAGSFREDLYYRLAVITIRTPSLRERKEDIPALIVHFLSAAVNSRTPGMPKHLPHIGRGALEKLLRHSWPGNVRELKNTLIRASAFCEDGIIHEENILLGPEALPEQAAPPPAGHRDTNNTIPAPQAERPENPGREAFAAQKASDANLADLYPRQREILARLTRVGSVNRREYQESAGNDISMRTAQYDLQELMRLGLVRAEGRGPARRYVLVVGIVARDTEDTTL